VLCQYSEAFRLYNLQGELVFALEYASQRMPPYDFNHELEMIVIAVPQDAEVLAAEFNHTNSSRRERCSVERAFQGSLQRSNTSKANSYFANLSPSPIRPLKACSKHAPEESGFIGSRSMASLYS